MAAEGSGAHKPLQCDAATERGENLFAPHFDIAPNSLSVPDCGAIRDIRSKGCSETRKEVQMRKRLAKALFNISEDDFASQRTFYHTMELLLVGVIALAIGFFAAGYLKGPERALKTDANAQRPAGAVVAPDTSPPLKPSGEVDPVLKKPEKGTDQHG